MLGLRHCSDIIGALMGRRSVVILNFVSEALGTRCGAAGQEAVASALINQGDMNVDK